MNWDEAVSAMQSGKRIQRASEMYRKQLPSSEETPVFECGEEPCFLAAAWTDANQPVRVFRGAFSKADFIPEDEHRNATDWEIVE